MLCASRNTGFWYSSYISSTSSCSFDKYSAFSSVEGGDIMCFSLLSCVMMINYYPWSHYYYQYNLKLGIVTVLSIPILLIVALIDIMMKVGTCPSYTIIRGQGYSMTAVNYERTSHTYMLLQQRGQQELYNSLSSKKKNVGSNSCPQGGDLQSCAEQTHQCTCIHVASSKLG